jgi:integrase
MYKLKALTLLVLAENGVPEKYLQLQLGHQNLEVTMRYYWHLTERIQKKGLDILNRMYLGRG